MPYKSASYPLLQVKLQHTYVNTTPLFSTRGEGLRVVFNCMERFSVTQNTTSSFHRSWSGLGVLAATEKQDQTY